MSFWKHFSLVTVNLCDRQVNDSVPEHTAVFGRVPSPVAPNDLSPGF